MSTPDARRIAGRPNRVVVLTVSLSRNAVGRAMVFVDLLSDVRDVVLAGPGKGPWWPPLAARRDIQVVEAPGNPFSAARWLQAEFARATIIASKPLLPTFGIGLASGLRPIVLDIDDPELALATANVRTVASVWLGLENPVITAGLIAARQRATAVTVSNEILRSRYGGTTVPMHEMSVSSRLAS
jgi:hypothetical protein